MAKKSDFKREILSFPNFVSYSMFHKSAYKPVFFVPFGRKNANFKSIMAYFDPLCPILTGFLFKIGFCGWKPKLYGKT